MRLREGDLVGDGAELMAEGGAEIFFRPGKEGGRLQGRLAW